MIKNFLDADEDDALITKKSADEQTADKNEFEKFAAPFSEIEDTEDFSQVPELKADLPDVSENRGIADETVNLEASNETSNNEFSKQEINFQLSAEKNRNDDDSFLKSAYQPESSAETIRKSGLAYSAAIILFGSIVFTLIIGWFADLLFGTSPWGIIAGIVLGSIIGFIQFFRITSQILKDKE